ncbi:MAG: hypothetical protein IAE79_28505 [Anaerolinea sp.]|nr:hypothetical protein [Anaerolinea sp.]
MKRSWWLGGCVLALVVIVAATAVAPSWAQEGTETTAVDPRFGAIEAFWEPEAAADLSVGWDRILFLWHEIQPTGPEDWNTLHVLEEWLVDAEANGRTVVGLLKSTPLWAAVDEPYAGVPRGLYLPLDDPENLWANYVRKVAAYYGARGVHHWIVWNEPDIAPGVYGYEFGGSMQDYYRLLQVTYLVMKEADSQAVIHLGGITYWHDPTYLRRFLQMVANDPNAAANNYYFDVLSQHIYFRPETVTEIVGESYAIQQEVGINPPKPVWINETNARPSLDVAWPVQVLRFHLDAEMQAWYLVQAYALGFAAGAERVGFYKLIDIHLEPGGESWGLLRPDKSQRPAYGAYKTMVAQLGGFTGPVTVQETADFAIVTFPKEDGLVRVLWAKKLAAVTLAVPALADAAQVVGHAGHTQDIASVDGSYLLTLAGARCYVECDIGGPPIYLVERGVTAVQAANLPTAPAPLAVATITPTPLIPATPTPTDTPSPTPTLTPSPAATPSPTTTPTPTMTPMTTPLPTITASPTTQLTKEPVRETAVAPTAAPVPVTSLPVGWWLLGSGVILGVFLLLIGRRQR